ncbi:MAG: MFS transporter [Tabrizicola sp.]|uniref:MFS transporter n=1 Tax=Tabrizicola sp. TaxID=2005166 RepID=UPI002736DCD5|nr:MFS transporter [Tabrizicola sp.]MDP3264770.1 MFS transporter [Tabrizicola sp.]MDP3647505.1 MFS transporter [Paracoccaceae bacterium]MDZ4067015.1 MFS transporter [Tabrizicola sp.]
MATARQRIWGWYFFDWASQPYNTLLLTFIFGPYFAEIARGYYMGAGLDEEAAKAAAQAYWGWGLAIASLGVAVLAPILGAIADGTGRRLVWVWAFSALYLAGSASLWHLAPGGEAGMLFWAVVAFGIGFIGMEFATIFTNALMPTLSDHDDLGAISGSGFAFGYLGGLLALILMLLFFAEGGDTGLTLLGREPLFGLDPEAREGTRAVGPFTAIWFAVFMIPFFLWVKEPRTDARPLHVGRAMASLRDLIRSLRFRHSLTAYLASSLFYRDALNALYGFGGVYASGVLGWSITKIGIFGIIGAVTAMLAAWLGGRADRRFGPKPVIAFCICVLILVCTIIVGMDRDTIWGIAMDPASSLPDQIFFACGALIGAAGGALQAASRTMMVRHTTPDHATEAFGLFALSGKVASFMAPALIALATMASGSQRIGISPLILLFLIGLVLLLWVKPRGELST